MPGIHAIDNDLLDYETPKKVYNSTTETDRLRNPIYTNRSEEPTIHTPAYWLNSELPLYAQILIATFCITMIVPAIIGNVLVIYTFCTVPRLKRYNNYYLVSLAICDLVGGIIIMPLYGTYWVLGYWPFGRHACEVYKFINHIFTHATFLSVLIIAVDRYRALSHPIRHLQEQTAKHAIIMISFTYFIPILLWSPLSLLQAFSNAFQYVWIDNHCLPFYSSQIALVISVSLLSILPIVITTIMYVLVYRIARKARYRSKCTNVKLREKIRHRGRLYRRPSRAHPDQHVEEGATSTMSKSNPLYSSWSSKPGRHVFKRSLSAGVRFSPTSFTNPSFDESSDKVTTNKTKRMLRKHFSTDNVFRRPPTLTSIGKQLSFTSTKNENSRATKTLTLTYFAMILSGLPWTFISLASQSCRSCVPYYFVQATVFTIHISSTIDPFCYAAANPQFKEAFMNVLRYWMETRQS